MGYEMSPFLITHSFQYTCSLENDQISQKLPTSKFHLVTLSISALLDASCLKPNCKTTSPSLEKRAGQQAKMVLKGTELPL